MTPPKLIDEIMERWDVLHQNTNQIAKSMAGRWLLNQAQVDKIVGDVLDQRCAEKQRGAA